MSCNIKRIKGCEIAGSTFNGRTLSLNRDISSDSFKAKVKTFNQKPIAEITGVKNATDVYFQFDTLQNLTQGLYIIEYWGDFDGIGNELFCVEEFSVVAPSKAGEAQCSESYNAFNFVTEYVSIDIQITPAINQFFLDFESLTDEQKAQLKGDAFTYEDFTPEQIAELQKPATDKVEELDALELSLTNSESLRVQNENTRISNEEIRNTNETDRSSSENLRQENEVSRQENENERILAETERNDTEIVRISNENTRISNENTRNTNEQTRVNAENNRVNAETSRSNAENTRVTSETERVSNENLRKTAENTRVSAETSRSNAENTRVNSENSRISNENSRVTAENNRVSNESGRVTAESARVTAENERKAAGYITSPNALVLQPITQADYNALAVKVPTTIYMIY